MFFGKKEPDKIGLDELEALLDSLFEKKLGNFSSRANALTNELHRAGIEFGNACNELELLNAEPYTDDLYFANVGAIKGQKSLYTKSLKRIIDGLYLEPDENQNSYDRYKLVLSDLDSTTNDILKTNANFKMVLHCYSNYLGSFKRAFSTIERFRETLRHEINSRSAEATEYRGLKERISRLGMYGEEIAALEQDIIALKDSLNRKDRNAIEEDEKRLLESLVAKKAELSQVNEEISRFSERISLLTIPLERPSKKQDHLSLGKKQLHHFIADPINNISSETDYEDFIKMVKELKENVEKGKIDTKNNDGVLNCISVLLNSDIYNNIQSLRSLRQKRLEAEEGFKTTERVLDEIKKGKGAEQDVANEIGTMEKRIEDIRESISATKIEVETMFSNSYRKPIFIVL